VISSVVAGSITSSGATITWTTDRQADSQVDYGTTASYGSSTALNSSLVTSHSQAVTGLTAATLYHYRVKSKDAYGQLSVSGDSTFTTSATAPSPPSFRARSTATNKTSATKPTGTAAGDLLLASLEVDADPVTVTGPTGWTKLLDTVASPGTSKVFHAQVWYKVAGASEPSSYAWSVPAGTYVDVAVMAYSNVDPNNPIDASAGSYAGVTATPSAPPVTTTAANEMVVALFMNYDFGSWTAGTGMTSRYNFDSCMAEDAVQAGSGPTGAKTARNSTSGPTSSQIVTLRPR
jgi:hypothetical protein